MEELVSILKLGFDSHHIKTDKTGVALYVAVEGDPRCCTGKEPPKSVFELTAEDLLGAFRVCPTPPADAPLPRRFSFTIPTRLVKFRHWCRVKTDRLRSLRRGSAGVVIRSRIAFCIIVFVGVVTALQLIPPIIELFK